MTTPLHCLIVEDSENDARLMVRQLSKGGYDVTWERVETAEAMRAAFSRRRWDVVLADYKLPHFSGPAALELLKASGRDLPFIIVSGTIGEEQAVAVMKAGAHDYVLKDRPGRLVPAVERELREAAGRRERRLDEETLQALSDRQDAILAAVPDVIMEVDSRKVYTWANPAGLAFFGDDVIGREAAFYFEGEQSTYRSVQPLLSGHQDLIYVESWQRRKDGERRLLAWWCRALKDESGNVTGALSSGRDITDQTRTEAALRESEARYRALFSESADGILIADIETRTFKFANPALCRMLGYPEDELRTMGLADIHPKDALQRVAAEFEAQARGDRALAPDLPCLRKDGSVLQVDVNAFRITIDGRLCIVGVFRDITERKQAEDAARVNQSLLRATLESTADGILVVGADGKVLDWNQQFQKMWRLPESVVDTRQDQKLLDHVLGQLVRPDDFLAGVRALYAQPDKESFDTLHFKDGRAFERYSCPQRIGDRIVGRVWSFRDVTERKQAEHKLAESETKLRALFEGSNYAIALAKDGITVLANPAYAELFGCAKASELIGKSLLDDIAPEDRPRVREFARRRSLGEPVPANYETRGLRRDGKVFDMAVTVSTYELKGEVYTVGILRDITAEKLAEAALRQSEERYRSLFNNATVGIYRTTPGGHIEAGNPALLRMLNYASLAELQQRNLEMDGFEPSYPRAEFRERMERDGEIIGLEAAWKRADGSVVFVRESARAVRDAAGKNVHYEGVVEDVTDRLQVEVRNREQAELLDNATDAIYVTALDCTILYWNKGAERTYGWTSAEAVNRKTTELLAADAAAAAALTAVLLEQNTWSGERWQMTKDGRKVEVLTRLKLVRDEQGRPKSIFAINTDVTEKKRLEDQFLRAQRLESIGVLASGIAHDLNNVLTPIIMGAPLLREKVKDEASSDLLKMIESSARRGAAVVKQVLTFARGVEGDRVPLQPRHLIQEVVRLAEETFAKSVRIESSVAADLWPVLGDATQLHQALLNLCVNARDAMPGGGVLTMEAANVVLSREAAEKIPGAQSGSYACLRVTDTGTGIPPEVEAKMFEPFFTTKSLGKGTGLGLSTVLGVLRSHGGFVRVVSKVGQGTTFELYLPAAATGQGTSQSASAAPWPRGRGECILVVDDEAAVREVARRTLAKFGYLVITAANGAEALRIFQERRQEIHAVLTDMMMPEMDGSALIAALKVLDPAVGIVGVTGMSDMETMRGFKSLGLSGMLAKPFTIETLLAAVQTALPVATGQEGSAPAGGGSRPI